MQPVQHAVSTQVSAACRRAVRLLQGGRAARGLAAAIERHDLARAGAATHARIPVPGGRLGESQRATSVQAPSRQS